MSARASCGGSFDVEEELALFFVRKHNDIQCQVDFSNTDRLIRPSSNSNSSADGVYEYIPLLLCDMPRSIDPTESSVYTFGNVRYRTCIIHATVVGRLADTDAYHKFVVDDGTRALELSVYRRRSDFEAMHRLQTELSLLKMKSAAAQNKNEVSDCLKRLLAKSMEQLNQSKISLGAKVLVLGRATWYRGQLGILALDMYCEKMFSRDLEIAFKDYLIEWYVRHTETRSEDLT